MIEFRMPSLGADMEAGTLVEWLVEPGSSAGRGDIIAVVALLISADHTSRVGHGCAPFGVHMFYSLV